MHEIIYPIDFHMDIELVIAPNLKINGVAPCLIPIDNIIGFDEVKKTENIKPIMLYPDPVVLEDRGLFTVIPKEGYWSPDLVNVEASHMYCLKLPSDLAEKTRQEILTVINDIHANRTLLKTRDIFDRVDNNPLVEARIKKAYAIESDIFNAKNGLSQLLSANGYVKAPQKRKKKNNNEASLGRSRELTLGVHQN